MTLQPISPSWLKARELRDAGYGWEDIAAKVPSLTRAEARFLVFGTPILEPRGKVARYRYPSVRTLLRDEIERLWKRGYKNKEIAFMVDRTPQQVASTVWLLKKTAEKAP